MNVHQTYGHTVQKPVTLLTLFVCGFAAHAQTDFDWITIGAPGNPAYTGGPGGELAGRGSVPYEYRIGKYEVTTAQWMEFVNTFTTQSEDLKFFGEPQYWGAEPDFSYEGPGRRYKINDDHGLTTPEMLAVSGISWRDAAMFCNWLHNGKRSDLKSLENGAYDTSTWGADFISGYTDAPTHEPGAKYWIPTLDEWLKAAHFSTDKDGAGHPGWYTYPNSSDEPPIPGSPGEGQTSGGWASYEAYWVPLGSYPESASPWGLLDATGATAEWTEEYSPRRTQRVVKGSFAGVEWDGGFADIIYRRSGRVPDLTDIGVGVRIATIPTSGTALIALAAFALFGMPQRRQS